MGPAGTGGTGQPRLAQNSVTISGNGGGNAVAGCTVDEVAVGGGFDLGATDLVVTGSTVFQDFEGWIATFRAGPVGGTAIVYAVCVPAAAP